MHLTRFSDISLRALMLLSSGDGGRVSTAELARRLHVSRDHLMKSLQALADLGLVEGTRGRGGGFTLAEGGAGMRLGTLVRALEPNVALAECFLPASTCPLTGHCRLAGALEDAAEAFFAALDRHTIADLRPESRTLVQLGGRRVGPHH